MTWVNHHTVFQRIARVDRTLLFLNLLLMGVAALPWPASVVAAYLREGNAAHVALAVYYAFNQTPVPTKAEPAVPGPSDR